MVVITAGRWTGIDRNPNRCLSVSPFLLVTVLGLTMAWKGLQHTLTGDRIEATTRSKGSSGVEFLALGLLDVGFGVFLVGRGMSGKPWP